MALELGLVLGFLVNFRVRVTVRVEGFVFRVMVWVMDTVRLGFRVRV